MYSVNSSVNSTSTRVERGITATTGADLSKRHIETVPKSLFIHFSYQSYIYIYFGWIKVRGRIENHCPRKIYQSIWNSSIKIWASRSTGQSKCVFSQTLLVQDGIYQSCLAMSCYRGNGRIFSRYRRNPIINLEKTPNPLFCHLRKGVLC